MKEPSENWGEPLDPAQVTAPLVYHFRPTKYLMIDDEHLKEWEDYFAAKVGFRPVPDAGTAGPWAGSPGGGVSGSNGGWDDCIN